MDYTDGPKSRFAEDLDLLRRQIAELKEMMLESAPAPAMRAQEPNAAQRAVERIKSEIEAQLGFVPSFLAPASEAPEVLAVLWQQMRSCYIKNPVPSLTKEKLFARLSRSCPVPYAIMAHSCNLKRLGMHAREILAWLERPTSSTEGDLEPYFALFAGSMRPLPSWPEPGSALEEALLECAIHFFRQPGLNPRCQAELLAVLGPAPYARLHSFLAYVRMHHAWLAAYPEPVLEENEGMQSALRALLAEEPRFGTFLNSYFEGAADRKPVDPTSWKERQICEKVLRDSREGIFTFDGDMVCTLWNPAMEKIFGVTESEAFGRIVFEVLPFLSETGDDHTLLAALRGETAAGQERPFHISGVGREGFYDVYCGPLSDSSGKINGGIAFFRDTTERHQAEQGRRATEERYLELFENANDIVYTHDLDGHITSINKAAERILGYARAEALQMKAGRLVVPEHLRTACKMIDCQIAGEDPGPYELEIICKDGRRVALEVNTHIISRDGKPLGVQGIARDITERKKTEEALQQAKQNLEAWVHELEQRTREMTLLSEMGDMLRACLTTDEAYTVIVRVAQQVFPVQTGALYVISPARNMVEAVAVWGDSTRIERVFAPDECWALRRGRVHWVEDASIGLICKHLHQAPPDGYLCVPMMAQSQALGILLLTQPANARLTEAKQRLALAMAEHIAMALSNLKLHETLRSQSIRDALTGLFNRRFMEESLELELRRAARNRRPLGMIMLEIDEFQAVTSAYGEEAGKAVLIETGNLLQTIIRKEDIACRFEGEKFAILLPQGNLEVTASRAESLREMFKNLEIRHRERPLGRVTFSAGVAGFPDQGRTVEALVRAADAALQRAKQEGGDRVLTAQ